MDDGDGDSRAPKATEKPEAAEPKDPVRSDLVGIELTLILVGGVLAVLAAFFLIGPVTGIVVLLGAVVLAIFALVRALRRAEVSD